MTVFADEVPESHSPSVLACVQLHSDKSTVHFLLSTKNTNGQNYRLAGEHSGGLQFYF